MCGVADQAAPAHRLHDGSQRPHPRTLLGVEVSSYMRQLLEELRDIEGLDQGPSPGQAAQPAGRRRVVAQREHRDGARGG